MSLHDYLPIKRRAPSSHENGTKKPKLDSKVMPPEPALQTSTGPALQTSTGPNLQTSTGPNTPQASINRPTRQASIRPTVQTSTRPTLQTTITFQKASGGQVAVEKAERTEVQQVVTPPRTPEKDPDAPPQLNRFKSFTVESPKKKSQLPAYQRYAALATQNELSLPDHYKLLGEKFRCADTVVNMLQKRREVCTLSKLKKAVQDMMRRTFEERNLGQMKTVHPTAFVFRQEKGVPGTYGDAREREQYHLTIECGGLGEDKFLDSAALVERTQAFRNGLLKIVSDHHKSFLKAMTPPIDIPEDKVIRWHPEFKLDTVLDVEAAELPKPPFKESYTSARDVLAAAHHRFASKLQRALANSSSQTCDETTPTTPHPPAPTTTTTPHPPAPTTTTTPHPPTTPTTPHPPTTTTTPHPPLAAPAPPQLDPTLVGISPLLLERIRQKEAARATAAITRDPAVEKKLYMLEKLPEMCRIVKTYFVSEQKAALLQDDVVQKVSESSGVSKELVEEHMQLLREAVPEWMALVTIRKRDYLKIKKNMEIKAIVGVLEQKRKQVSNE